MTKTAKYVALLAAAMALHGVSVRAADQTILGKLLLVKDPAPDQAPDPTRRKIKVAGKESPSTATIAGDPTVGGASLRVIANGANDYDETYPMPAAAWVNIGNEVLKYSDSAGLHGPVVKAVVVARSGRFVFKAIVLGRNGTVTVEAPNPGTDGAAVFAIAGGDTYCMVFGGAAGGTVVNFPSGNPFRVFKVRNATAEPGCPA
jgi:hypothetical protein